MMEMFDQATLRDPYPLYARMRAAAPVSRDPATGAWMLFDYANVRQALQDHRAFSSQVSPPPSAPAQWLIFSDPPRHTQLRALVMRAFTPRAVAALEPRVRELAAQLLAAAAERGEMELVADFSVPLPLMVIAEMLGAPLEDWPRFRRWVDAILGLIQVLNGPEQALRAGEGFRAVHAEMEAYLPPLLEQRRAAPRDDLLSRLLAAEVEGMRLADAEILGFFQLLLLAGHETSANLIGNTVLCLLDHPDQAALLRMVPELLPTAVEEVLRYRSPVQVAFRLAREQVQLGDATIPAGSLVLACVGSANRDGAHFADPERFDAARTPNPHLAFGHGIHFCIGSALARLEGRVALGELLRLPELSRAGASEWTPRPTFHVHGPTRLPLRFGRVAPGAAH